MFSSSQILQLREDLLYHSLHVESLVCRNLIVSGTSCMKFSPCFTHPPDEFRLYVHVNILEIPSPYKTALFYVSFYLLEALYQLFRLFFLTPALRRVLT